MESKLLFVVRASVILILVVTVTNAQSRGLSQLINLGSQFGAAAPSCAVLSSTSRCLVTVPDDGIHNNIRSYGFVFASGIIRDKCSLTIRDYSGSLFTSWNVFLQSRDQYKVATSVCCECNGCHRRTFPELHANTCAILFENKRCSMCHGCRLEVRDGDNSTTMHSNLDNKVSSLYLAPDCQFKAFKEPNFQGEYAIATGSIHEVPDDWNNNISSYQCHCLGDTRTSKPSPGTSTTDKFPVY